MGSEHRRDVARDWRARRAYRSGRRSNCAARISPPRPTFTVREGERLQFLLIWHPSHEGVEQPPGAEQAMEHTCEWWEEWCRQCTYEGEWRADVLRSLMVLKALTFEPTGGIVAAPTTSLPEQIGGVRNWDYRFCWLRDATFTLYSLLSCGFTSEAASWRTWLLRAAAGDPSDLQTMYGPRGERRLTELELPWLPGYESSKPVRIGNAAVDQLQLDVYGEVMDALYVALRDGVEVDPEAWALQQLLVGYLEDAWQQPDEGIWEVRGPRRHFTHSKVMCWVAVDRAIKSILNYGCVGPVDRWMALRDEIHQDVCARGFNPSRGAFTQSYGSDDLDASLLMIPLVGFLPPEDPRVAGTTAAIERELMENGLVHRYRAARAPAVDGLPPEKACFSRAPTGCVTTTRSPGATPTRESCSSGSSPSATISACCRKNTTRARGGCSATSRRRFLTCP